MGQNRLFIGAIFLSSFLLFLIQPMISQMLLPWFGGGTVVWATAIVFFQVMLLAGYAYAHLLSRLPQRTQIIIHGALALLTLFSLPILPDASLKPLPEQSPTWHMLYVLCRTIGLPYLLLSSTAPLLQAWYARMPEMTSAYRLYAVSNAASFIALFAYPLLVQTTLPLPWQGYAWSGMFLAALACLGLCGHAYMRTSAAKGLTPKERVPAMKIALWIFLSFTGSALSLSVTNQLTLDIAPTPFLWILPLAVYLATFVIVFSDDFWYERNKFTALYMVMLFGVIASQAGGQILPALPAVITYLVLLFTGCMICHGELAKLRPPATNLTAFYLAMSFGGALGGIFVAIVAPALFSGYWEFPVAAFLCLGIGLAVTVLNRHNGVWLKTRPLTALSALICVIAIASLQATSVETFYRHTIFVKRNLYGILRVKEYDTNGTARRRELLNGSTLHGVQYLAQDSRDLPTSYYGKQSGLGRLMALFPAETSLNTGVIGLGTGNVAVFADDNDTMTFFEIDADVQTVSRGQFFYLDESRGEVSVILGDARLSLERLEAQNFDVLVIDAFSSDAIPTHLITYEAFLEYKRHLKPGGVLAVHISNRHLDLRPVLAAASEATGMSLNIISSDATGIESASTWGLMSSDEASLASFGETEDIRPTRLWTDSYSSLLSIIQ